jgi:hypothetical protein
MLTVPVLVLTLLGSVPRQATASQATAAAEQVVVLDHAAPGVGLVGSIRLSDAERFEIDLKNTFPQCFDYNADVVKAPPPGGAGFGTVAPQTVIFEVIHSKDVSAYTITATRKKIADPILANDCMTHVAPGYPDKAQWQINATTGAWTLGFAGAFTADKLNDPSFSLVPGSQVDSGGKAVSGFFVKRDAASANRVGLGGAAMIHLFHSDPGNLAIWREIAWAPLSLGIGFTGGSQARYLFGTSLKFGDAAFLTAGVVIGSVKRLPAGLSDGGFTTDSNALSNLGTRTTAAAFVGLSYAFLGDKNSIVSAFKTVNPAPAAAPKAQ